MNSETPTEAHEHGVTALRQLYAARFFRKHPAESPELLRLVSRAARVAPHELPLLYIWGVHEKSRVDSFDRETIDYLRALLTRIGDALRVTPVLKILLADSHATLNGVAPQRAALYTRAVAGCFEKWGWEISLMSDLWRDADISLEKIARLAVGVDVPRRLAGFSRRHCRGVPADIGAARYLIARQLEKPVVTARFAGHVLVTPVEPALDSVQPELPIFHVWTRKKGCSAKPWFTTGGA